MRKISFRFNKKITNKIIVLSLGGILILGFVLGTFFIYQLNETSESAVNELETTLKNDFDLSAKEKVETVFGVMESCYKSYQREEFSLQEAKKTAAQIIRDLHYGKEGYFWVDTKEGVNVVFLGKDDEGKNRIDAKDSNGNLFIKEIIDKALEGGGYTDYWFPKKGSDVPMPKRSYSMYFEPFNWVVGTGNYIDDIETLVKEREVEIDKVFKESIITLVIVLFIAFGISALIAVWVGRRISKPIIKLAKNAEQISEGNISIHINTDQKDEVGKLAKSFNKMVQHLRETILSITESIENVKHGSNQISVSAQQIAQGANQQAASAEEIGSSIEQVSATISQNTQNAQVTERIAIKAEQGIVKGHDATKKTLKTMLEIADKILVITKIAEKTDLLAINAAIEASKAGTHGKGFAVVANEIRQLSETAQKSANEIVNLADDSVRIAKESDSVFNEIAPDVKKTAKLVQEITAANIEQKTSIDQITQAVMQFNSVVQENSATAEELSSGSEELASQAMSLRDAISFFSLENETNKMQKLQEKVMDYVTKAFQNMEVDNLNDLEFSFSKKEDKKNESDSDKKNNNTESNEGINIKLDDSKTDDDYQEF